MRAKSRWVAVLVCIKLPPIYDLLMWVLWVKIELFRDSTYVGLGMYKLTPVYDQLMRVLWVKMELVGSDVGATSKKSEMM